MNFADTNWLVSSYIEPDNSEPEAITRRSVVSRFMRRHGGQLTISQTVLLEARNVFSRITGEARPIEWELLEADFGGRLRVDPMNWDLLQNECNLLFEKYAWKIELGTYDTSIVASAKLGGATQFLSFDLSARLLAVAEGLLVFPPLDAAGKSRLSRMKQR